MVGMWLDLVEPASVERSLFAEEWESSITTLMFAFVFVHALPIKRLGSSTAAPLGAEGRNQQVQITSQREAYSKRKRYYAQ